MRNNVGFKNKNILTKYKTNMVDGPHSALGNATILRNKTVETLLSIAATEETAGSLGRDLCQEERARRRWQTCRRVASLHHLGLGHCSSRDWLIALITSRCSCTYEYLQRALTFGLSLAASWEMRRNIWRLFNGCVCSADRRRAYTFENEHLSGLTNK